jgi:hypothetical protein
MVEARCNATLQVPNSLGEVATEQITLSALDLAVLHRTAAQFVVELAGLVGSSTVLVLCRLAPDPKVHVPSEPKKTFLVWGPCCTYASLLFCLVRVQNDVAVAAMELAVLARRPWLHLELLDAPYLETRLLACICPLWFSIRGSFLAHLFNV